MVVYVLIESTHIFVQANYPYIGVAISSRGGSVTYFSGFCCVPLGTGVTALFIGALAAYSVVSTYHLVGTR